MEGLVRPMGNLDFFDLNEPKDLYKLILDAYSEYQADPSERDFFFLVLGFTHLREWIAGCSGQEMARKLRDNAPLSDGERFFEEIGSLPEFKTVKGLCNRGKHHIQRGGGPVTSKIEGLRVGLGRVGDSLDQRYFLVDNNDSRDLFIALIHKYNQWFGLYESGISE